MPELYQPLSQDLITQRILFFFNQIRSNKDLERSPLLAHNEESANLEGKSLADYILEARMQLPLRRFTEIDQLQGIPGMNEESFTHLSRYMGLSAAEQFKRDMYDRVLLSNFELSYQRITFEDADFFASIISDKASLAETVAANLLLDSMGPLTEIEVRRQIRHSFLDTYTNGHLASFALALWFYEFDLDNWFTFDQVRESTEPYMDQHPLSSDRQDLHLFKGFDNKLLISGARTITHLPVVVNHAERSVTLWLCSLKD